MKTCSAVVLLNADTDFHIGYEPGDQLLLVLEVTGVPVNDGESAQIIVHRIFQWLSSCIRPFPRALRPLSIGDIVVVVPGSGLQPKAYAINFFGLRGADF